MDVSQNTEDENKVEIHDQIIYKYMTIIGVFPPRIQSVTCFSAHVFPRAPLLTCFPALSTYYIFSRFFHRLQVSPRFTLVTCFPVLYTGCLFSLAFHWLSVFPRFPLVVYFPALSTSCLFSRALHWLSVFPSFLLVSCDVLLQLVRKSN